MINAGDRWGDWPEVRRERKSWGQMRAELEFYRWWGAREED